MQLHLRGVPTHAPSLHSTAPTMHSWGWGFADKLTWQPSLTWGDTPAFALPPLPSAQTLPDGWLSPQFPTQRLPGSFQHQLTAPGFFMLPTPAGPGGVTAGTSPLGPPLPWPFQEAAPHLPPFLAILVFGTGWFP